MKTTINKPIANFFRPLFKKYRYECNCICNVLGSNDYIRALAIFGMIVSLIDILQISRSGLALKKIWKANFNLKSYFSPHVERDMKFCMTILNLQTNILLLVGVKYDILAFYLVYLFVEILTVALHMTYANLLLMSQLRLISPWQVFLLGFRIHNIFQVVCSFRSLII